MKNLERRDKMSTQKTKIAAVVGPTASGKSALAVELCKALHGQVLSCDSMQIYRGMNIGTAKPTEREMGGVLHRLIDIADPLVPFSCADYVEAAEAAVEETVDAGYLPVFCGGTGLYLDRFLSGGVNDAAAGNPAVREELFAYARNYGAHALYERLAKVDPESAAATHENNLKRVVRALEIYITTGKTKTELDRATQVAESPYEAKIIGLCFENRALLYRRIEDRVDQMIANGLVEETRALMAAGVFEHNTTAAQAIGYKELFSHLSGEEPLEMAAERLKTATRRYAKRQLTWFSAKEDIHWIRADRNGAVRPLDDIVHEALKYLLKN